MKYSVLIVVICCFLANLTYLAYLESQASPIRISRNVKTSYDVLELCGEICNRQNDSCFPPQSLILYYRETNLDDMTFTQKFQPYVRYQDILSVHREFQSKKYQKRKYCPLEDIDPQYETLSKQNSCAIVGNGGIVLGNRCGREIDSHDFVLRANLAHIRGYETDVGGRTSIMMINDESLRNVYYTLIERKNGKESFDDMVKYLTDHLNGSVLWFAKGTEVHGSAAKLQKIARFLSNNNLRPKLAYSLMTVEGAVSRTWKKFQYYPSSGFDMLALAETLCQTITLYGFYPYDVDPRGRNVLHHYYEPTLVNFSTNIHNFNAEHIILKEMDRKGLLRLAYDPC